MLLDVELEPVELVLGEGVGGRDDAVDALLEADLGLEAQHVFDPLRVRPEAVRVDLDRDVHEDGRGRDAELLAHDLDDVVEGVLHAVAEIQGNEAGQVRLHRVHNRSRDVGDEDEVAGLLAVAPDDRLVAGHHGPGEQARDVGVAELGVLADAIDAERPECGRADAVAVEIPLGFELTPVLATGLGVRRVEHHVFLERDARSFVPFLVDGAGRRPHHRLGVRLEVPDRLEEGFEAHHGEIARGQVLLLVHDEARGGGQVNDAIGLLDQIRDQAVVARVAVDPGHVVMGEDLRAIAEAEVVEADHGVPALDQEFHHGATDESGRSGNQDGLRHGDTVLFLEAPEMSGPAHHTNFSQVMEMFDYNNFYRIKTSYTLP